MPDTVTTIAKTVSIRGDVSATEHLVIDGRVEGTISLQAHALSIGEHATIKADVLARSITIFGRVSGNLVATEMIDMRESARVEGVLACPRVAMTEGAWFNGTIDPKRADAAARVARYRADRRPG
jgi:cytoskeletal protein CcmA (bactofilin family)